MALVRGAKVKVHSLQSEKHAPRNGCFGTLVSFIVESGRWVVDLECHPRASLALRPANLEFIAAPAPRYGPGGAFAWPARVAERDTLMGISASIFSDPHTFLPQPGSSGMVGDAWGMTRSLDEMSFMMRRMTTQDLYGNWGSSRIDKTPEQQWVEVRKEVKRKQLATRREDTLKAVPGDFEIRIELVHSNNNGAPKPMRPPIWREVRLAGATNLGVFQDKILAPVVGWARNYHGYFFMDFSDGALWCPIGKSHAIDMMHVPMHVTGALDPFETELRDLLVASGAMIGYTHDLGDQFEHVITCTRVLGADESTGACTVLGGAMRCPNEDGHGNSSYQEEVLDVLGQPRKLAAACSERQGSVNCKSGKFDPLEFSVQACQQALNEALGSKASAHSGPKKFVHEFFPGASQVFGPATAPGQKQSSHGCMTGKRMGLFCVSRCRTCRTPCLSASSRR
jgi:hypothetical protein